MSHTVQGYNYSRQQYKYVLGINVANIIRFNILLDVFLNSQLALNAKDTRLFFSQKLTPR